MVITMAEPHKRAKRHPKYKTAYRVRNWNEYDQALRDRGDITLWVSQDAIDAWRALQTGKRGAQPIYSDMAIETALTLRLLFHLPLRQTEGFPGSITGQHRHGCGVPSALERSRMRSNGLTDGGEKPHPA
jgi:hypothetical protein